MREWHVATLTGGSAVLTEAEVAECRASLRGKLLLPGSPPMMRSGASGMLISTSTPPSLPAVWG
jgi:hypothetical protein